MLLHMLVISPKLSAPVWGETWGSGVPAGASFRRLDRRSVIDRLYKRPFVPFRENQPLLQPLIFSRKKHSVVIRRRIEGLQRVMKLQSGLI